MSGERRAIVETLAAATMLRRPEPTKVRVELMTLYTTAIPTRLGSLCCYEVSVTP